MSNINITTISGRLVREPIFRAGSNGGAYALLTVAVNHRWTDRSGNVQAEAAFIPCKCFGAWVEALRGKAKGEMLVATGRLRTETWERDGTQVSQLGLVCATVHSLSQRRSEQTHEPQAVKVQQTVEQSERDAIPF